MPETKLPSRNEPCHCGSGKKYKQCCLEKDEAAAREERARVQEAATPSTPAKTEAPERHREAPARPSTHQPWKKSQNTRGGARFTSPRKVGGS